jgi:hypothetical protein
MSAAPKHPIAPDERGAHSLHRLVGRLAEGLEDFWPGIIMIALLLAALIVLKIAQAK